MEQLVMEKIAKFEFVSENEFQKAELENAIEIYKKLKLPKRATISSAGYDFYSPIDFILNPGETIKIPTGIRCKMQANYVLLILPRSSLGFKYRLALDNTVGVIDADYYNALNEGHIFIKMTNNSNKTLEVKQGDGFAQGIFLQYGITIDDDVKEERVGGFGSTNKGN